MDFYSVDRCWICVYGCVGIMFLLVMVVVVYGFRCGFMIMWIKGSFVGMKYFLFLKEVVMKCGIILFYVGDIISWRKCCDWYEVGNIF